jgi:hypothetical protein
MIVDAEADTKRRQWCTRRRHTVALDTEATELAALLSGLGHRREQEARTFADRLRRLRRHDILFHVLADRQQPTALEAKQPHAPQSVRFTVPSERRYFHPVILRRFPLPVARLPPTFPLGAPQDLR